MQINLSRNICSQRQFRKHDLVHMTNNRYPSSSYSRSSCCGNGHREPFSSRAIGSISARCLTNLSSIRVSSHQSNYGSISLICSMLTSIRGWHLFMPAFLRTPFQAGTGHTHFVFWPTMVKSIRYGAMLT